MGSGENSEAARTVAAYFFARDSMMQRRTSSRLPGTSWEESRQASRIRAGISPGEEKTGSSGSINERAAGASSAILASSS